MGELVDPVRDVLVEVGGRGEVGERVEGVSVAAVLGDYDVRVEGAQRLRDDGLETLDPGLVIGKGLQRHVDRVPDSFSPPPLLDAAGSGEEVFAGLVHRNGQHVRVLVEHPLHPVSVVGVGVHVGYADAGMLLFQTRDGDPGVVVDAETTGL